MEKAMQTDANKSTVYKTVDDKIAATATRAALEPLSENAQSLLVGGLYQHYSGNHYTISAIARHTETLEEYVVYTKAVGDGHTPEDNVWIRPVEMFTETIMINQEALPRFALIRKKI